MAGNALRVDKYAAKHRELSFARFEHKRVMDHLEVLRGEGVLPPESLNRQRILLEAEINTLNSDLEG